MTTDVLGQPENLGGYNVYVSTTPGNFGSPVVTVPTNSAEITDLDPGTTYYVSVTAYDLAGNESAFSTLFAGEATP